MRIVPTSWNHLLLLPIIGFVLLGDAGESSAAFISYADESTWQSAAGTFSLEDFESYSAGVQISSLPSLGIEFETLDGGGFPVTYNFGGPSHGPMHLANFPNGINAINRYDDIILKANTGVFITALGFWNGDGQSDTLFATAYDASDNVVGTIGAFKDTFAGFTSNDGVVRVVFDGNTGDGWNHLDGLQVSTTPVPEPASGTLVALGLLSLSARRRGIQAVRLT